MLHFIFPGRMALIDLPYETLRVARLLDRHGFNSLYGARLRLEPLDGDATVVLEDEVGDTLSVVEVPPLELSLSSGERPEDSFELQRFAVRSRFETNLKGPFRSLTGNERGPASLERLSQKGK